MPSASASVIKRFIETDAAAAAAALERLKPEEAGAVLRALPASSAAACLERSQPTFAAAVLERFSPDPARAILERFPVHHAADVFRGLSPEGQKALLEPLSAERKRELQEYLSYPADSAGRLMRSDFVAFPSGLKVREVIARLRALAQRQSAPGYSYVLGPDNVLLGVLNMRDLLLADPDARAEEVMRREVRAVSGFTDREELAQAAAKSHFLSMPVVDPAGRLLGVVRADDLLQGSQEEGAEDLQILFGGSADERPFSPVLFKVRRRLPWLVINLGTAFLAGWVVSFFEELISRVAVLAVFLTVVAGQGGNAGGQSLSVVLRGLVMREVSPRDAGRLVAREMAAGLVNGALIGLITALAAWLWQGNPYLGLVIALAMVSNLVAAGFAGAAIPLLMKRAGFDPAQSSGIFITTVTDVVGFFSFLGLATLFQAKLL